MDKWKVVLIIFLLGGLGAYGLYQQNAARQPASGQATPAPLEDFTKSLLMGKPAPAWNIPTNLWMNTPQPIALQDVKGHVTVLEFFRIGCPHCEEAAPFMTGLYQKFREHGLRMVAFQSPGRSLEKERDWNTVQATVRRWKITYPVAFDKGDIVFKKYNGSRYPTMLALDEQGVVRFYQTGHSQAKAEALESFVAEALKK
jgi:thiol-disulfide isomerase/thioredoxin